MFLKVSTFIHSRSFTLSTEPGHKIFIQVIYQFCILSDRAEHELQCTETYSRSTKLNSEVKHLMNLAVDSDPKGQDVSWLDDRTWSESNQQIFIGCFLRAGDTTRVVGPRARPGRALRPDSCAAPGAASLHQPGAAWPGYSRGEIQAHTCRLDANTRFPQHITHCMF